MSHSSLATASSELDRLNSQVRLMDAVRTAAALGASRLNSLEPPACAMSHDDVSLLDSAFSRRADHYLVYAAGYAVLEAFVNDIVKSALRFYERSSAYADLSPRTKKALRLGTAHVLNRLNWRRFSHLSELLVAQNFYNALSGGSLQIADEVIISSDANYRADEIKEVLAKSGLALVWSRVKQDAELDGFFTSTILEDNTLESALNMVVGRRNEVAHGVVKSIDSTDILLEILNFLKVFFQAITRSSTEEFVNLIAQKGKVRRVGVIVQRFHQTIGIVEMNAGEWVRQGDLMLVTRGGGLRPRIVSSMQLDGTPVHALRGSKHLEVGIDFGAKISPIGELFRLTDPQDEDLVRAGETL